MDDDQWMNAEIIAGILDGAVLITFFVGVVGATIEVWKVRLKSFLMA